MVPIADGDRSVCVERAAGQRDAAARSCANDVRHLERCPDGLGALVDPRIRLVAALEREHTERTGTPVSSAASWRPLAASPATYSKCGVSPRMTHPSATMQANRRVFASAVAASGSSNAPGTDEHGDRVARDTGLLELRERALEEPRRHLAVEAGDDDSDGTPAARRLAFENGVAVGDPSSPAACSAHRRCLRLGLASSDRLGLRPRHGLALAPPPRRYVVDGRLGLGGRGGAASNRAPRLRVVRRGLGLLRVGAPEKSNGAPASSSSAGWSSGSCVVGLVSLRSRPSATTPRARSRSTRRCPGSLVSLLAGLGLEADALVVELLAEQMPELVALHVEVAPVLVVGQDLDRHLLDDGQPVGLDALHLARIVREEPDGGQPEVGQDLVPEAVLARVGREAELDVRLDRVEALLLELVRPQLVQEPDPLPSWAM